MFRSIIKKSIILGAVAIMGISNSYASKDGDRDDTSEGDVDVYAEVPELVRISHLSDISFAWSGAGNLIRSEDVCVWTNAASGNYQITITGDGGTGSNQFKLSGATDVLDYNIFWNDISGSNAGEIATTSSAVLINQTGANTQNSVCAVGGLSARFRIEIPEAGANGLGAAAADTYNGVITFLVSPE